MRDAIIHVACVVILAVTSAGAATITVDWSGSGDFTAIQAGIDAAGAGDTVLVMPGTYTGTANRNLDFGGTNLVLVSDGGRSATIIDCETAGCGFHFHSGEDTTSIVEGFTITGAAADSGAGAFCENGSGPRFEDCRFLDNTAQNLGGGLCCSASSPIVENCTFELNTADENGGSHGDGGGMACLSGSSPRVENTEFLGNEGRTNGGGLCADYAPVKCYGCTFAGNNILSYGYQGAGAALAHSDGAVFSGCAFIGNGTGSPAVGGGIYVTSTDITITSCSFIDNRAGNGGAIHFTDGSGGTVSGCTFAGNTTDWSACGGITCFFNSNPAISSCTFVDNEQDHIWCDDSSPTVTYSILAFAVDGVALRCMEGTETPDIHHCFVFGNDEGDTLCGGNFHDIINSDPLFCDRAGGNLMLCADSPCVVGATWPSYVGAHGEGCPACGSAAEPTRWGTIKALYK
jgi:predicted outer membrane repeat protein